MLNLWASSADYQIEDLAGYSIWPEVEMTGRHAPQIHFLQNRVIATETTTRLRRTEINSRAILETNMPPLPDDSQPAGSHVKRFLVRAGIKRNCVYDKRLAGACTIWNRPNLLEIMRNT